MRDMHKTKKQLVGDLAESRYAVARLKKSETEYKQVDEALRKSDEQLRLFIEHAPAAIAMFDRDMRYIAYSRRWLSDYSLGNQDITGRTHYEVFPEIPQRWKKIHQRALAGGVEKCEEDPFPRLDGRLDWVRWEVRPWYEHSGEIGGVIMFTEVITERKKAEEELARYRTRLEDLVQERTAEVNMRNAQLEREISERKRAENEKKRLEDHVVQTQRLEAVGRFAGGIAHDLNNILYPIVVNTEILLAESQEGTDQHRMLEEIAEAAHRQRDLVKQILSFGRQSEPKLIPVRVAPLLQEALTFIRSSLPSTIEIKQRIDAHSDLVLGDPTQVHQIIMNLLRNAVDAIETQRGTIRIGLENVHLGSSPETKDADYLELTVSDTGCGMSEEIRKRIFDPFFTTKEVGKGTGMGLSFVHGILRSHRGMISVESKPGKGSKFTVHIPLYKEKPREQARDQEMSKPKGNRGEILLVDDEAMILSSIRRVLQHGGYHVTAVRDGMEALELFRDRPDEFELVITDLTMPKMTGVELARKLVKIRPGVPIILSTGYSDVINEKETKSIGIRELLHKPSSARELEASVRRSLGR